jgi:hypothetical protein
VRRLKERVIARLLQLGYSYTETDYDLIDYSIEYVERYIKNFCNINEIPTSAEYIECDMICGEFLYLKKSTDQLTDYNLTENIGSVKLGDMSVSFNGMSQEQQLDTLISWLRNKDGDLICYRTLRW